ncbi:hypothetical protein [Mesonia aestuariivivens]|uniref:Type I-B CRISPR-associated protein Cas8b1/Cst1 n=1 Tax=Mesonia aestuariivivens TaxID=2796128 RepID=A0ABS6VZT5_9FLAO|nr:hypothetical protein [Mesonia aestuariivivens]MBW2961104.1 hypothetical protein [Mesonia aestuariivivens]
MNKIEFNKTSNIFINSGIVALYRYLGQYERKNSNEKFNFRLLDDKLIVESENLLSLLEEVYYFMGKDIYDTSSKKQLDKLENVYYDVKKDEFHRFPKIYTYGLAELLTNNAQGTTKMKENSPKIKNLEKEQPDVANKIKDYFDKNNLKLLSKVYLNEPYTKITTIDLQDKYWIDGKEYCYLTGEHFKSLVNAINISPFIKGLTTFNSFLNSSDGKVSQKGLYLLRFSPALAMYSYYKGYDSFISSFFNSNSLLEINDLYKSEFFYENEIMQSWKMPFKRNIKLHNFSFARKGKEDYSLDAAEDSFSPQEITFLILLTFYKKKFADELTIQNISKTETTDILSLLKIDKSPISLVTFKADKFASTLRPNFYEEYTNVKFVIQLIHKLETNKDKRVAIGEIWRGLIFKTSKTESIKDYNKRLNLERQIRIKVIECLLKGKSILPILESLFHKSYLLLANGDNSGYRRYDLILEFLIIYEQTINFKLNEMNESLQQKAISLGKSIGYAIINYGEPKNDTEKKANAKNGRKYLISLHKARTIDQFRETLIRIQRKYLVSISNEILENLNEKNYVAVKQYAQIGALNSLNVVLSNQKES